MIKKIIKDLNTNLIGKLFIFTICSVGFGLIALLLALKLSPWFYAVNTRVRLYLDAPAETEIIICWAKSQTQCLPLVPYSTANNRIAEPGEAANLWMSELPPRSSYSITLIFKANFKEAIFHNLELDSSNILLFGKVQGAGVSKLRLGVDQFKPYGISATKIDSLHRIAGAPSFRLTLNREIYPGPPDVSGNGKTIIVWGLLFSLYLGVAGPIFLLPHILLNLGSWIRIAH